MNYFATPAIEQSQAAASAKSNRFRAALRFALPQRKPIIAIIGLMLFTAAINAVEPLILKSLFDELAAHQRARVLLTGLGLLVAFAVVREAMDGTSDWLTWRTRIGLQYTLLEATVGKLHKMPLRMQRSEGRLSSSRTGFRRSFTPTASWCSKTDASSRAAHTPNC